MCEPWVFRLSGRSNSSTLVGAAAVSSGISVQSTNFGHFDQTATERFTAVQGCAGLSCARLGYAGMGLGWAQRVHPRKSQHVGWSNRVSSGTSAQSIKFGHFGQMATERFAAVQIPAFRLEQPIQAFRLSRSNSGTSTKWLQNDSPQCKFQQFG